MEFLKSTYNSVNEIVVSGCGNLPVWGTNKSKKYITKDGNSWWWFPHRVYKGDIDSLYM